MKTSKITKAFSADISIEEGERAVVARITTAAVDRDGEVLIPQGCNTKDFEKNPVVFLNHNYYSLPVAKCTSIKRDDGQIIAKTVFPVRPESHPEDQEWVPDTLLSLFKQGVIKGFSVGFIPVEARPATDRDVENYGAGCRRVYSKWKLLEYSVAPLPANQEAVAMAVAKSLLTADTAEKLFGFKAGDMPVAEPEAEDDDGEEIECPSCGEEVEPTDDGMCPECGKPMKVCGDEDKPKSVTLDVSCVTATPLKVVMLHIEQPKCVTLSVDERIGAEIAKRRGKVYL